MSIKLAVFISGRGSNLQALIDHCQDKDFPAEISVVLSNRPDAKGLELAEEAGVPTEVVDHSNYKSKEDFEFDVRETLSAYAVDLICLAGFMRILSPEFISHWPERIINIHPSLLPDYKGLNTYERAIADHQKESGCTVHFVTPIMDDGPIIMQAKVPILDDDTPDMLAARILTQEHILYPAAVKRIAETI